MKKLFTRDEIANQLVATQSADFYGNCVEYFIHLNNDGEFQISCDHAAASFTASATPADYGWTQEQWDAMESPEEIYDRETLDDPTFAEIVDSLTDQANAWLEENC